MSGATVELPLSEYERQMALMVEVFAMITRAKTNILKMPPSREGALTITKLDEAEMWAMRIPMPPREAPENPDGPTAAN